MREFIGDHIHIDGRMIGYRIFTSSQYLAEKYPEWTEDQREDFAENHHDVYQTINQILALKQSCYLLRRTRYSCGSLSDDLFQLKLKLIRELRDKHKFEFDEELVEKYCEGGD